MTDRTPYRVVIVNQESERALCIESFRVEEAARTLANVVAAGLPQHCRAEVRCGYGRSASLLYATAATIDPEDLIV